MDGNGALLQRRPAEIRKAEEKLDQIRGCMFGGTVGDALGYPVEFQSASQIAQYYPSGRIEAYDLDFETGTALISDDTQMSLFTANGLLVQDTRLRMLRGGMGYSGDGIENPMNNSKGCGGIMRVAPIALWYRNNDMKALDEEAAQLAAITHGHPLGCLSAAALAHILHRIVFGMENAETLEDVVRDAEQGMKDAFGDNEGTRTLNGIMENAVAVAANGETDPENIRRLGEGWTGEEALAIGLYCALRHRNDFSAGVVAAVNHDGDSDSTGAITGNILGALLGYSAIGEEWRKGLELSDVILELADDICRGCQTDGRSPHEDPDWVRKYVNMRWKA